MWRYSLRRILPSLSVNHPAREALDATSSKKERLTLYPCIELKLELKGGKPMALKQGETYRCPDAECGCEITVTRGANPNCKANLNLRCCCGKEMVKI